ncbi:zinc finger protein 699-like [Eriocheir sinensis]|uniref:zinc finger protein 699-like n=1 Tax=Eriocheir sinensis TaxID=95602 RepID=UPI0021C783B3|nr:zinc finger protein 699-like [Eriocheir sinensis]
MGSLGCPLCCQQDFGSVGALRDHLIYYIYRPLQCGVCCQHLNGIQELTTHFKCHMSDGLPATAKLACPKPPPSTGGESNVPSTPPPTDTTAQESAAADPDAGIGSSQLSDGFSNYMKGNDAANQLLKLREWQLEKWGKNFSRQRASFGKSPGMLELSPASGRMHRGSPPVGARDRRPSSQNSCCTPRSDVHSLGRSIDSVERFDSSATPLSVYGNTGSMDVSDHSICPQSAGKDVSEDLGLHSPAQAISASYGPPSLPPEQTAPSPLKAVAASPNPGMPSSPVIMGAAILPKNVNYLGCVPPESSASCDVDVNQQPGSVASPSLYVLSAQEVASCSLPPSRNEFQDLQEYSVCGTEFAKHSSKSPEAPNSAINVDSYENSNNLPLLGTVDSDEFSADVCSPSKQHQELQPVTANRELPQSITPTELQSVTVNEEQPQPLTVDTEQLHSVTADEAQPQPDTVNRDLLQSLTLSKEQQQPVTFDMEEKSGVASGMPELWATCPSNQSPAVDKHSEISSKPQQQSGTDGDLLIDSQLSDIEDSFSNRNAAYSYWSSNYDEGNFHTDIINSISRNVSSDDALKMRSNTHFQDGKNTSTSAFQCSGNEGQAVQEGRCEGLCFPSTDTMPYLHKKFHHDQERKVLPNTGVDQVADVSQYINSFQSVLVRKLNGTLGAGIPMISNICSTSSKKPEKEMSQEGLEQPHQTHQPQTKEHTCEVCHQKYKNLSAFKLHCKEHKKDDKDSSTGNLYKECPKEPPKEKRRKNESYQCDQCSKPFLKAFNFARHMREVHAIKKSFTCLQCNKAFSSKRHLQEHSEIHKDKKAHECPQCHHLCYTASGLRTHIQEIHSNLEQHAYYCDVCGDKFAKVYGLKRHKERKHTKNQLTCHICSKSFFCKEDMNKHSRTHVGVATLKCDSCDKTFSTSWVLQRHSKIHQSTPKTFTCNICNLSFTRRDSLASHCNAHAQKRPFVCHCGKRFVRKSQLKEHQDKHSTIPKYSCSVCKHSFKFRVSLKNHSCKKKENETIN